METLLALEKPRALMPDSELVSAFHGPDVGPGMAEL
jgi:hypothetical protein